jgi:hypothetical protein
VLVEIEGDGHIRATSITLNRWNSINLTTDIGDAGSSRQLEEMVLADVASQLEELHRERTLVRVTLTGAIPAALALDSYTLERELREAAGVALIKIRDRTSPAHDIERAALERTARGSFTRHTLAAIDGAADPEERALLEDALRYGLTALSGAEVGLR